MEAAREHVKKRRAPSNEEEHLAEMLEDVHRDFKIKDKVTVTTTDNGSNFVKAFSVFAEVQRAIRDREEEDEEGEDEHPVFINVTDLLNETEEDCRSTQASTKMSVILLKSLK